MFSPIFFNIEQFAASINDDHESSGSTRFIVINIRYIDVDENPVRKIRPECKAGRECYIIGREWRNADKSIINLKAEIYAVPPKGGQVERDSKAAVVGRRAGN